MSVASQASSTSGAQDRVGLLCACLLVAAFGLATARAEPAAPGAVLPWTLDPTGLHSLTSYVALYVLSVPAKNALDLIIDFAVVHLCGPPRIDECKSGSVKRLEHLELQDKCFLAFDTIVEFVGLNHIAAFFLTPHVNWQLASLGVLNGPVAYIVVLLVNDIVYYPFHWAAHLRAVYPCWHKQHHRQSVPFRGVMDAANLNPNESTYGFMIFIASLASASWTTGLHSSAAWCALITWAALNISNHSPYASPVHVPLPYPATPGDHQMHHRIPQCNYCTLTTLPDRLLGTFRAYKPLPGAPALPGRPVELLPSPWCFAALAGGLGFFALACEAGRVWMLAQPQHPLAFDLIAIFPPTAFCAVAGASCAAAQRLMLSDSKRA